MILIPYDIVEAHVPFRLATYPRPCVITSALSDGRFDVMLISSALELYKGPSVHFKIYIDDPEFPKTGLKKESYAAQDRQVNISLDKIIRKRGRLEGELLKRFLKWLN